MPEGGRVRVSVNVDFKDVWSAVHDVADWIGSETTVNLRDQRVRDPEGRAVPNELTGWVAEPQQLVHTEKWTATSSDTRIRFGVNWYYGGQSATGPLHRQRRHLLRGEGDRVVGEVPRGRSLRQPVERRQWRRAPRRQHVHRLLPVRLAVRQRHVPILHPGRRRRPLLGRLNRADGRAGRVGPPFSVLRSPATQAALGRSFAGAPSLHPAR